MGENNDTKKTPAATGFYTYRSGQPAAPEEPADGAAPDAPAEAAAEIEPSSGIVADTPLPLPQAVVDEALPEERQKRKKVWMGVVGVLLFAAILCTLGLLSNKLGLTGQENLSISKTQLSAKSAKTQKDATDYLKAQSWEKKKHESLKSLSKMKNLRYALDFFQNYMPQVIAAIPATPCTIDDVILKYDSLVGSMVSIDAAVIQKYPVTENIKLDSDTPSTLVSMATGQQTSSASMLVIGSSLDDVKAGDKIKFVGLPVYFYSPDDSSGSVSIFFITIPELVHKG